jgi:hypothetical protein
VRGRGETREQIVAELERVTSWRQKSPAAAGDVDDVEPDGVPDQLELWP